MTDAAPRLLERWWNGDGDAMLTLLDFYSRGLISDSHLREVEQEILTVIFWLALGDGKQSVLGAFWSRGRPRNGRSRKAERSAFADDLLDSARGPGLDEE